jgi:hypothetical protein
MEVSEICTVVAETRNSILWTKLCHLMRCKSVNWLSLGNKRSEYAHFFELNFPVCLIIADPVLLLCRG